MRLRAEAQALDFAAHFLVHGDANRFVQIALILAEFDALDDFDLLRQLQCHTGFRAPQNERSNAPRQNVAALG